MQTLTDLVQKAGPRAAAGLGDSAVFRPWDAAGEEHQDREPQDWLLLEWGWVGFRVMLGFKLGRQEGSVVPQNRVSGREQAGKEQGLGSSHTFNLVVFNWGSKSVNNYLIIGQTSMC